MNFIKKYIFHHKTPFIFMAWLTLFSMAWHSKGFTLCSVLYRINPGNTFFSIALAHGIPVETLQKYNIQLKSHNLPLGQDLSIPLLRFGLRYCESSFMPNFSSLPASHSKFIYKAKKGDTIWKITKRFRMSKKRFMTLNQIKKNAINANQLLTVEYPKSLQMKHEINGQDLFSMPFLQGKSIHFPKKIPKHNLSRRFHSFDFALSAQEGLVVFQGDIAKKKVVILRHAPNLFTIYLSKNFKITTTIGQHVARSQIIAIPNKHKQEYLNFKFYIWNNQSLQNPEQYLTFTKKQLHS